MLKLQPLCKYSHVFGKENEGIHSVRLFNVAIFDVVGTIVFAFICASWFALDIWHVLLVLFAVSLIVHKLFCVNTTFTSFVFG